MEHLPSPKRRAPAPTFLAPEDQPRQGDTQWPYQPSHGATQGYLSASASEATGLATSDNDTFGADGGEEDGADDAWTTSRTVRSSTSGATGRSTIYDESVATPPIGHGYPGQPRGHSWLRARGFQVDEPKPIVTDIHNSAHLATARTATHQAIAEGDQEMCEWLHQNRTSTQDDNMPPFLQSAHDRKHGEGEGEGARVRARPRAGAQRTHQRTHRLTRSTTVCPPPL